MEGCIRKEGGFRTLSDSELKCVSGGLSNIIRTTGASYAHYHGTSGGDAFFAGGWMETIHAKGGNDYIYVGGGLSGIGTPYSLSLHGDGGDDTFVFARETGGSQGWHYVAGGTGNDAVIFQDSSSNFRLMGTDRSGQEYWRNTQTGTYYILSSIEHVQFESASNDWGDNSLGLFDPYQGRDLMEPVQEIHLPVSFLDGHQMVLDAYVGFNWFYNFMGAVWESRDQNLIPNTANAFFNFLVSPAVQAYSGMSEQELANLRQVVINESHRHFDRFDMGNLREFAESANAALNSFIVHMYRYMDARDLPWDTVPVDKSRFWDL